jgi:hypothetical protein
LIDDIIVIAGMVSFLDSGIVLSSRVGAVSYMFYLKLFSSSFCSASGICIPLSVTVISNLSPFFKLNPSTTGLGRTTTELEPTDVSVTVYLVGIL